MKISVFYRTISICALLFLIAGTVIQAQQSHSMYQAPEKGSRIWSGTGDVNISNWYRIQKRDDTTRLNKETQSELNIQFRFLHFQTPFIALGLEGFTDFYIEGFFNNVALGNGGLGPLLRFYPIYSLMDTAWQPYLQIGILAGYNLALGDSIGAIPGESFRVRSSALAGFTWRIGNRTGIYFEAGRAWESKMLWNPDATAWQMNIGIQLFRF